MGRYIAKSLVSQTKLSNLIDVDINTLLDNDGLSYDTSSNKWINDPTIEQTDNKNIPNGYAGLDTNGDIDAGTF